MSDIVIKKMYWMNGKLESKRSYKGIVEHGKSKGWDYYGFPSFITYHINGKLHGKQKYIWYDRVTNTKDIEIYYWIHGELVAKKSGVNIN